MGVCKQQHVSLPLVSLPKWLGVADEQGPFYVSRRRWHSHLWRCGETSAPCYQSIFCSTYLTNASMLSFAKGIEFLRVKNISAFVLKVLQEIFHFLVYILQKPVSCKPCCCSFPNGKICVDFGHEYSAQTEKVTALFLRGD